MAVANDHIALSRLLVLQSRRRMLQLTKTLAKRRGSTSLHTRAAALQTGVHKAQKAYSAMEPNILLPPTSRAAVKLRARLADIAESLASDMVGGMHLLPLDQRFEMATDIQQMLGDFAASCRNSIRPRR